MTRRIIDPYFSRWYLRKDPMYTPDGPDETKPLEPEQDKVIKTLDDKLSAFEQRMAKRKAEEAEEERRAQEKLKQFPKRG